MSAQRIISEKYVLTYEGHDSSDRAAVEENNFYGACLHAQQRHSDIKPVSWSCSQMLTCKQQFILRQNQSESVTTRRHVESDGNTGNTAFIRIWKRAQRLSPVCFLRSLISISWAPSVGGATTAGVRSDQTKIPSESRSPSLPDSLSYLRCGPLPHVSSHTTSQRLHGDGR